jgi:pyruvate/2-oxoglutarate dehydrogenase complex dihydrolipoamide acyltransferase (E2) component
MSVAIVIPKLGDIMESAIVSKWLKTEGDWVNVGDALFDLESDKVSFTVEAMHEGHLHQLAREGSELAVGDLAGVLMTREEAEGARRRSDGTP